MEPLSITPAEIIAGVILISLIIYSLSGGADFGAGVWNLLAAGPRAEKQNELIAKAISPIWEANHVWLILALVLLFTGFPQAYSAVSTALHIPLTIMLLGIVLRGAAFAFGHYDPNRDENQRWRRVFEISSTITPVFLGICIATIASGNLKMSGDIPAAGFFKPWLGMFQFMVGLFTLAVFSMLAAVYLTKETEDSELQNDYRVRAIGAGIAVALIGVIILSLAPDILVQSFKTPVMMITLVSGWLATLGTLLTLWHHSYGLARISAIIQVTMIVAGWGFAQYPCLVVPDITIDSAAAPDLTLKLVIAALALGAVILFPSMFWLMKIFKFNRSGY